MGEEEVMKKLKFDDRHEPYFNLLPLSFRLSRLMREYLNRQIVDNVLIPYVGYNEMSYITMKAQVKYQQNGVEEKGAGDDELFCEWGKTVQRKYIFERTGNPVEMVSGREWTVLEMNGEKYDGPLFHGSYHGVEEESSSSDLGVGNLFDSFWDSDLDGSSDDSWWR